MKLADFKQADGEYLYNGCSYPDLTDLVTVGILRFCGCGAPTENLAFILGALELIEERRDEQVDWKAWYKGFRQREIAHFGNASSAQFFYYWADHAKLTEHGSSVNGSWLTDKGHQLLDVLKEWRDTPED